MADNTDWVPVCLDGGRMSAGEAAKLELELFAAPDNVHARVSLLGYYFLNRTPEAHDRRNNHIFWFIENRPEIELHAYNSILQRDAPEAYGKAKQLWTTVIANRGDDVEILQRASEFFTINDRAVAEDLLRRGAALEPSAAYWRKNLAHLHSLAMRHADSPERRAETARDALDEYEAALGLETSPDGRYGLMIDAAKAAFLAKDYQRATEYAERVLATASDFQGTWVYGNGIHHGHIVLGRVALANDDVPGARDHLAAAGAMPGSPQLNSFGPDQDLAVELLARGEREAVIAYADACRRFYGGALGRLGAAFRTPD